jgi:hypothetical protein
MKSGRFIATYWTAVVLLCASAHAQDLNRVPDISRRVDAVDAPVHSDFVGRALQEHQLSQEPVKLPTTYSRWAFDFPGQPPATRYWPTQANILTSNAKPGEVENLSTLGSPSFQGGARTLASAVWSARSSELTINLVNKINSGKPDQHQSQFNSLTIGHTLNSSNDPKRPKTIRASLPSQPQTDGFSTPFRVRQFGVSNISSLPYLFSKTSSSSKRAAAKQHKRLLQQKIADDNRNSTTTGFSHHHRKLVDSPLAAKAK